MMVLVLFVYLTDQQQPPNSKMKYPQLFGLATNDKIQLSLAVITLLAVLVALFGERLWKWVDRPKVSVDFDQSSERCLRWAMVDPCNVQDEGQHRNVKRYYFRLRVQNQGSAAKKLRVRAELLDKTNTPIDRFEPTELNWISGIPKVDLARGESEYVNLLSQVVSHPGIKNRLTVEVSNTSPRGIAWDRPLETYTLEVTVYGDNIDPVQSQFRFKPKKDITKPGELKLV